MKCRKEVFNHAATVIRRINTDRVMRAKELRPEKLRDNHADGIDRQLQPSRELSQRDRVDA